MAYATTRDILLREWDSVRKPVLEKLNAMHADIILTCNDKNIDDSTADALRNIERLTRKNKEVTE